MRECPLGAECLELPPVLGEAVPHTGDRDGEEPPPLVDPLAEARDREPSRDLLEVLAVDVRDEEPGRVRPEVDRCDAGHRSREEHAQPAGPTLRGLERAQEHLELRPRHAEALGCRLEILARAIGLGEQLLGARRALLEQRELARDRAARPLSLPPQRDAADGGDDDADERRARGRRGMR